MEANKTKGEAKSIFLDNGAELTYCERGSENKEVLIAGAFYIHTLMPVLEELATRYHVYGVVMRFDGITDELNEDGSTNWARQWGKDVYDFSKKLGINEFHYFGKCHGTIPGWYQVKEHPEVLKSFASFYLAPNLCKPNSNQWIGLLSGNDTSKMMAAAMRKPEGLKAKMEEMATIGPNASSPSVLAYGGAAERIWPSLEACEEDLKNTNVPIGFMFGSEDPLFQDNYDSNMKIPFLVKGCRFVILNGERHLMELDCPDRVASEVFMFIDESVKKY